MFVEKQKHVKSKCRRRLYYRRLSETEVDQAEMKHLIDIKNERTLSLELGAVLFSTRLKHAVLAHLAVELLRRANVAEDGKYAREDEFELGICQGNFRMRIFVYIYIYDIYTIYICTPIYRKAPVLDQARLARYLGGPCPGPRGDYLSVADGPRASRQGRGRVFLGPFL
jgi:hypothetical protein